MSYQMLTSALERLVKHPLFQRDRFGKMDLPRMAQQAVGSYQPRFSEASCPIPTPMPNAATCPSFPSLPYLRQQGSPSAFPHHTKPRFSGSTIHKNGRESFLLGLQLKPTV